MHIKGCIYTLMSRNPETDLPAPSLTRCAQASLRRAMRVVSQHYDQALKPAGLRATQYTVLSVLDQAGLFGELGEQVPGDLAGRKRARFRHGVLLVDRLESPMVA